MSIIALILLIGSFIHAGQTTLPAAPVTSEEPTEIRRQEFLHELKRMLPDSEAWDKWLEESGELPPDFSQMQSIPFIPDPLRFQDGRTVESRDQWMERREDLLQLLQYYLIGTYPDPPDVFHAELRSTNENDRVTVTEVELKFGPEMAASLTFEVFRPHGDGPFPVFITQHNHRRWAAVATSRGYAAVVYAGSDSQDDTEAWIPLYPGYDWNRLTRRAWAAGRVIDYLETLDYIDHDRIALTGHSRNGKVAVIGGVIDKRVDAVISSSSGAAGVLSFRSFSEAEFGESIERMSRVYPSWVHPRLRFFSGREDRLPVDAPNQAALIAPRPFLYTHALNDQYEGSVWDLENSYRSTRRVYDLLDASDRVGLLYREGSHGTRAEDIEQYLDWLDYQFGRSPYSPENDPLYPTIDDWRKHAEYIPNPLEYPEFDGEPVDPLLMSDGSVISNRDDWQTKAADIQQRMERMMGSAPPEIHSMPGRYGRERLYIAQMLGRAETPDDIDKLSLNFGNYLNGDLYFPKDLIQRVTGSEKKRGAAPGGVEKENIRQADSRQDSLLPVVIWLHPISPAWGYRESYTIGKHTYLKLVEAGFIVLALDMIGHGSRLEEVFRFHQRYPDWTILGKMVHDVRQAVDALHELHSNPMEGDDPQVHTGLIDPDHIYLFGYGMGGRVALHAAALDDRISGSVVLSGFTPMRSDTPDRHTGGLARWSDYYPLQPWLSEFIGHETRVPYDYHEVLSVIAPRPVSVISPLIDRQASPDDVMAAVEAARGIYRLFGEENRLRNLIPDDYSWLGTDMQRLVIEELNQIKSYRRSKPN